MAESDKEVANELLNEVEEKDDYENAPINAESAIDRKLLSDDDWKRSFSCFLLFCQEEHLNISMIQSLALNCPAPRPANNQYGY
ncbi:hypothetical protein L5515_017095 [Caenorhabditis briggsae]|uniref:Uncharacterized protein n=1 Tax=Caenorhabditis briggsae TaxID=6238 RepID=A0AAE9JPM4_CAEBR|nr:hypothetical protein L5515_017095 [Caenorhabditis briggsae]